MDPTSPSENAVREELERLRARLAELESMGSRSARSPARNLGSVPDTAAPELDRAVLRDAPTYIFATDRQHRYILANEAYARHLGTEVERILGRTHRDLFPAELADYWVKVNDRIMASGEPLGADEEVFGRVMRVSKYPLRDRDGNVTGLCGFITDITDRSRIAESCRLQAEIVTHLQEGVILINAEDGVILHANPGFCRMLGYEAAELVGQNIHLINAGEARTPEEIAREIRERIERTGTWSGEIRNRRKDGSCIWCYASVSTFEHPVHGRVWVALHLDVTARREVEEQLRQSEKLESLGHFAAGMAHEFNNLVAAILLHASLARSHPDPGTEPDPLGQIESLCHRASDLIRQLLAFGRRSSLTPELLDLGAIVASQYHAIRQLVGDEIRVDLDCGEALPLVQADRAAVEQIILHLVRNARDAMPAGGTLQIRLATIEFSSAAVSTGAAPRAGRFLRLTVRDTGRGLDATARRRLFEPFFTTKPTGGGAGMGLAVARGLVDQLQGWIQFAGEPGHGAVFHVFLPAAVRAVEPIPAEPPPPRAPEKPPRKATILLVEDAIPLRQAMRLFLGQIGYVVREADDGDSALAVWERHRDEIDLVLTDLMMPGGINGLELAERILAERPTVKIILTSGHPTDSIDLARLAARNIVYLAKPCPVQTIAATIRTCLQPA